MLLPLCLETTMLADACKMSPLSLPYGGSPTKSFIQHTLSSDITRNLLPAPLPLPPKAILPRCTFRDHVGYGWQGGILGSAQGLPRPVHSMEQSFLHSQPCRRTAPPTIQACDSTCVPQCWRAGLRVAGRLCQETVPRGIEA